MIFIKHRKALALQPKLGNMVRAAYQINGLASPLLFEAIDNPTIEIPELEGKRPKMDEIREHKMKLLNNH